MKQPFTIPISMHQQSVVFYNVFVGRIANQS